MFIRMLSQRPWLAATASRLSTMNLSSVARLEPYEIFLQPLPRTNLCSTVASSHRLPLPTEGIPPYQLQKVHKTDKKLQGLVQRLSQVLLLCHPKRIPWSNEEHKNITDVHIYRHNVLVSPIASIFSQLRTVSISDPLQCKMTAFDEGTSIFEFHINGLQSYGKMVQPPVVILTSQRISCGVNDLSSLYSGLPALLQHVWRLHQSGAYILCSDFESLVVSHPPEAQDIAYEHTSIAGNLVKLRIIIAAYLYEFLSQHYPNIYYIDYPRTPDDLDLILPQGVPIDPRILMRPDEEIFTQYHRHSDFDFYTLTQDWRRALQFFRWKAHIKNNGSPEIASPHDVLHGVTNGFLQHHHEIVPYYSASDLPLDTQDHIRSIQRPCALGDTRDSFFSSKTFSLVILEEVVSNPERHMKLCRTYTCHITSIDGNVQHNSPVLFLKLFDDRFHLMEAPEEEEIISLQFKNFWLNRYYQWWWGRYTTSEDCVRNEDAAYKKLNSVQGSLIPWYYGSHVFTLPNNNHQVYGILTEYVSAHSLDTGVASNLSTEEQVLLVRSARHAVRAMECADISQHDWHSGQILCSPLGPKPTHCVLIDFSYTTQSVAPNILHATNDFAECLHVLMGPEVGLDRDLVSDNFGTMEPWGISTFHYAIDGRKKCAGPVDPFAFVYNEDC